MGGLGLQWLSGSRACAWGSGGGRTERKLGGCKDTFSSRVKELSTLGEGGVDQHISGNSVLGICAWSPFPPLIIGLLRVPGRISAQIHF